MSAAASARSGAGPFVVDLRDLPRQPGQAKSLERRLSAPSDWAVAMIGLKAGQPLDLVCQLEAVGEGVWVSGRVDFGLVGQCSRCLTEIDRPGQALFQDLFVYPGRAVEDADLARVVGQTIDLEPLARDAVVLDLPLAPLCRDDCLGLCAQCGANLNDDPRHSHTDAVDERWVGLSQWVQSQSE
ncbi:MAG: DUF177 domain-containing protein [Propionibacteriaceae bacterium]|jgi:uncharacterized protein|nr:DUF177 domain-containing protein [Propionibacteriaceae bacterium]